MNFICTVKLFCKSVISGLTNSAADATTMLIRSFFSVSNV